MLKLAKDPRENAMMLQQMGGDDMLDGDFDDALCTNDGLVKHDFEVGLQNQ